MVSAWGFIRSAAALGCALGLASCDEPSSTSHTTTPAIAAHKPQRPASAQITAPAPTEQAHQTSADTLSVSEIPDEAPTAPVGSAQVKSTVKLIIDEPQAIGPAGQMSAEERGVVMVDRESHVQLARHGPLSASAEPDSAHFSLIHGAPNDFFAVARGPLLLRGKAYWVSDGKLVRRWITRRP